MNKKLYFDGTLKTFIDNIYLNSNEFQTFSGNLTYLISDHLLHKSTVT